MKIKFLGAVGTVTGSSYVLTSDSGQSILIDLGMFQGTEDVQALNYDEYDYDCSTLSGAILTHAHLDHCGRLPFLLKDNYRGSIWLTPPTADLANLVLLDSAKIAKFDNDEALYDKKLVQKTVKRFSVVDYHQEFKIKDLLINFVDAGHILGAASIEITDTKASSGFRKIVFSGDLGNYPEDLQPPTEFLEKADAVVMESTYGDKQHPDENPDLIIQNEIKAVQESGSVLMIPSFSLERTQVLLHKIKHYKENGEINKDIPVYLDSPMAQRATEIYIDHAHMFNEHIVQEFKHENPFSFPGMRLINSRRESERIWHDRGPKVIIAGGGMMTGGRIVSHAAHYLPMESARLLIVGYQGEDTLGRELLEGNKEVVIDEVPIKVRASVNDTQTMSSHAGQSQLIEWLGKIKGVKKVFLTHGEDEARTALAEKITEELDISDVNLPILNQEIVF